MVFEIKIPEVPPGQASTELSQGLIKLLPDFSIMLLSFVILGIYWVGHNNVFLHVLHHDRLLLWLNILFLLTVALIPFPAALLVRYGDEQISVILYALNLAIGGVLLDLIWTYATYNRHLMCDSIQPDLICSFHVRILTGPVIYLVAVGLSFFSLLVAKILFGLAIVPKRQTRAVPNLRKGQLQIWTTGEGVQVLIQQSFGLAAKPGSVVLLEEPETHLHPRAIAQSTGHLRRDVPGHSNLPDHT